MEYISFNFLLFFLAVIVVFFCVNKTLQNLLLLAASYFYYMCWNMEMVLMLIACTGITYVSARKIESSNLENKRILRNLGIAIGLLFPLGSLIIFKYTNFFLGSICSLCSIANISIHIPYLNILIPIGISFYSFKTVSYIFDVSNEVTVAERNFFSYALYVSFFPQILAGPIDRAKNMLPQFRVRQNFEASKMVTALKLIVWGLFQKFVIADRLATVTNSIYDNVGGFNGWPLIIATLAFTIQIYFDFSGYTDIARGIAKAFGYSTMKNFDNPYMSSSITEFWRKWHISFSSWLSDYVFTPLHFKMRSLKMAGTILAAVCTFLISGLWHGAAWTYVLWGFCHGIGIALDLITKKARRKMNSFFETRVGKTLSTMVTFSFVSLTFVFFRSNSVADAFYVFANLFKVKGSSPLGNGLLLTHLDYLILAISFLIVGIRYWVKRQTPDQGIFKKTQGGFLKWSFYYALCILILFFRADSGSQFIYVQF